MLICSIKIDGFKNIFDTEINFNHFNALVALNNYGKSNLLEAINFANKFIQAGNKEKSLMVQSQNKIPINNLTAGRDFKFEVEFESKYDNVEYDGIYSFSFEWLNQRNLGGKVKSETLKVKRREKDAKYSTYIHRDTNKQVYISSKTGRCDRQIVIGDNALIVNKLLNFDDLFYLELIKQINNVNLEFYSLNDIEKHFSPGFGLKQTPIISHFNEIPNIANFFYNLKLKHESQYELLVNSIQDLLPDIEYIEPIEIDFKKDSQTLTNGSIPYELPEKAYDIRVKVGTNNQETSIANLSVGSKRIFYILASALKAEMLNIQLLSLEELENSIHPALLQRLAYMISELTTTTRIVITSHSPYLIKYIDINDIYLGIPNQDGVAYFKRIKKTKQNKLLQYAKDAENNIGDFIFDMLVEGFNDNSFWNNFI
jgi:predicted ATPase